MPKIMSVAGFAVQMMHSWFLILVLMVKNEATADPAGPAGLIIKDNHKF